MKILLDTNRLTDALGNDPRITGIVEEAVEIWLPFIAIAELKSGFLGGSRANENEGLLQAFLRLPGVDILYADGGTTDVYARLFIQLRSAGTPVPTNVLWIASLAVQHQLVLLTRDEHFDRLPQVARA